MYRTFKIFEELSNFTIKEYSDTDKKAMILKISEIVPLLE